MVRAGSPNQGRKPLSPLAYPKGARPGSASVATGDGSQGVFPANSRRGASPAITREGNQDSGSETGSVFVTGPGSEAAVILCAQKFNAELVTWSTKRVEPKLCRPQGSVKIKYG